MAEAHHTWADVAYAVANNPAAIGILVGAIAISIVMLAAAFGEWILDLD